MKPTYSIVIPLYNHEKYIVEALNSCIGQTFQPSEIIVVDDGSKDKSLQVAHEIASRYPLIKVHHQKNQGAHVAINNGIRMATSDYVAILNSDDVYMENRFEEIFKDHDQNSDLIFTGVEFINSDSQRLSNVTWYNKALSFFKKTNLEIGLLNANFTMTTSNFIFKKSMFTSLNGFSDYRYAHDLDFLLRGVAEKRSYSFIDKELIKYRLHSSNTIKESKDGIFREVISIQKNYLRLSKSGHLKELITLLLNFKNGYHSYWFET
jgi:glycosyltransferase involved in cell wall biosynthesis